MIIASTGDIHSPRYFELFVKAVEDLRVEIVEPDLFLLAGDVIQAGNVKEYHRVYNVLFGKITCPIVACFGNDEYEQNWSTIKEENPDIKFLDDESLILEINGKSVGIVGTKGSLDRPTWWQRKNIPGIWDKYRERVGIVEKLLSELKTDVKILLIHYVPTYKILEGENPISYPELGCNAYEKVLIEQKPDVVITGHSHRGKKQVWVDTVPVFNVALPLNEGIVVIDTEELKPGLEKFF
ncbi:MAG: metallophosphoesterase [Candidatus Latescibacterota bacterium]|nr:MAG: metallophosphoesterase [Candidatus Latescibacterota bacterium]